MPWLFPISQKVRYFWNVMLFSFSLIVLGTITIVYVFTQILRSIVDLKDDTAVLSSFEGSWLFRLSLNILGYATIFVPGFLIFKYIKSSNYLERTGKNFRLLKELESPLMFDKIVIWYDSDVDPYCNLNIWAQL